MHFLVLSGSFHKNSYTLRIAEVVKKHLAAHRCDVPSLQTLPFYTQDLATDKPENIKRLLQAVSACDAIICVTPEYNHSIPAVLKNALDWASRPAFKSPLKDKPVTVITQADGSVGGVRAQAHLKLVLDSTLSVIFPSHEMMIASVSKVMNANGAITDADTSRRLTRHLDEFAAFVEKRKQASQK